MTIALGMLVGNSMVLAADTQMSTDTEKVSESKISYQFDWLDSSTPPGVIAITGSGDSWILRALQDDLSELFSENKTESMKELGVVFDTALKKFYREYIAITPDTAQRPEVELIIAVRRGVCSRMWVSKRNRLSLAKSTVAVGSGGAYAQTLLSDIDLPKDETSTMLIAAYVAFLVKLRNLWVGMDTQVLFLGEEFKPPPFMWNTSVCRKLEDFFRAYIGIESRILHRVFGSQYDFVEATRISGDIEGLRNRIAGFIDQIKPPRPQPTEEGDPSRE